MYRLSLSILWQYVQVYRQVPECCCCLQESEGLELEPAVLTKGIEQLLEDSTKGHYYVIKVRSSCSALIGPVSLVR